MFRPVPAIIRFSSERVSVFTRYVRLCNDGEFSSSVVFHYYYYYIYYIIYYYNNSNNKKPQMMRSHHRYTAAQIL